MKLIEEWKTCWKFLSVQANAIGAAISMTYVTMYDHLKADLPPKYMAAATAGVFILGILGRVISQSGSKAKDE